MEQPNEDRPRVGAGESNEEPRILLVLAYVLVLSVLWGGLMFAGDRFLFERDASGSDLAADADWRTLFFFVVVTGLIFCDGWWRRRSAQGSTKNTTKIGHR